MLLCAAGLARRRVPAGVASNDLLSVTCVRQKSSTVSVVLLKDHEGLGVKGEEKHVKPGFMRNFLYPSGVATYGIPENIAKFKTVFEDDTTAARKALKKEMAKFEKKLSAVPISIRRNSTDGVKCSPGEVTAANIVEKTLRQRGLALDPARISLKAHSMNSADADDEVEGSEEVVEEGEGEVEDDGTDVVAANAPTFPLKALGTYRAVYAFNPAAALGADSENTTEDILVNFKINISPR